MVQMKTLEEIFVLTHLTMIRMEWWITSTEMAMVMLTALVMMMTATVSLMRIQMDGTLMGMECPTDGKPLMD